MKIEEWLLAGEYVLAHENPNLMFCERGIRTFETYTRNTLDLSSIPIIKQESHCPIVIDPSQGAGRADLVSALCKGAVAMGADALLIEVHPNPAEALSDGAQQVSLGDVCAADAGIAPAHRRGGQGVSSGESSPPSGRQPVGCVTRKSTTSRRIPRRGTFRMASRHRDTWSGSRTILSSCRKTNSSAAIEPARPAQLGFTLG